MLKTIFDDELKKIKASYCYAMIKDVCYDYWTNEYVGSFVDPSDEKLIEVRATSDVAENSFDIFQNIIEFERERDVACGIVR